MASTKPIGLSVAQIRHHYGFDLIPQDGKGQQIAILSAFDNQTLGADLEQFDSVMGVQQMFGLPGKRACTTRDGRHPCFEVTRPAGLRTDSADSDAIRSPVPIQSDQRFRRTEGVLADTKLLGMQQVGIGTSTSAG